MARTFVEVVNGGGRTFDVVEVLRVLTMRCVDLMDIAAAGILLGDRQGRWRVVGASNKDVERLLMFQVRHDEGPGVDCARSGAAAASADLLRASAWPRFGAASVDAGFPSVWAIPLRFQDVILGCLNVFRSEPVVLVEDDAVLAGALADVASLAIVHDRTMRDAQIREEKLQRALHARVVVEQAKGMIVEREGVGLDAALVRLRTFARTSNLGLTKAAETVVAAGRRGGPPARRPPAWVTRSDDVRTGSRHRTRRR
jgi:GAF domain-containing protein